MSIRLADIVDHPEQAGKVPAEAIPALLAQIAAVQSALAARLLSPFVDRPHNSGNSGTDCGHTDQLLTVAEASSLLAFKPAYLYELVRQGRFPAVRQGKYIRICVADLQRWIQQNLNKPLDRV